MQKYFRGAAIVALVMGAAQGAWAAAETADDGATLSEVVVTRLLSIDWGPVPPGTDVTGAPGTPVPAPGPGDDWIEPEVTLTSARPTRRPLR